MSGDRFTVTSTQRRLGCWVPKERAEYIAKRWRDLGLGNVMVIRDNNTKTPLVGGGEAAK